MKALSLKNPWAYLIFCEGKDVENRTHPTKYRGELLIHASKKSVDFGNCMVLMPRQYTVFDIINLRRCAELFNGFIIGTVRIVDCVQNSKSKWAQKDLWHWILENPVLLHEPVRMNGKLGLWEAGDIFK